MYLGLAEHVTVVVKSTMPAQVVVASSATEHVAMNMAAEHFKVCFTRAMERNGIAAAGILGDGAAPDGSNLTATEGTITHMAAVDTHMGLVHTAVVNIATAEDATGICQKGVGRRLGAVFYLLLIIAIFIVIADVAVHQGQVGRSIDSTTFATTVDITLNGGDAVGESGACQVADDHVGLAVNVIGR